MSDKYATNALQLATLVQLKHLSLKSNHSTKKYSTIGSNVTMDNYKAKFFAVYEILKSEILADPAAHYTDQSREWVEMMLEHNVPHGKLNRGLAVIDSYVLLKGEMVTDDEFFLASVLGWAIEWLQACFLVLDDIMDESLTRRGQPCWFRLPMCQYLAMDYLEMYSDDATGMQVGNIAVNDGVLLHSHIGRILKKHFHTKFFCTDLLDLFNEVGFQTACGQMLDLITTYDRDLEKCKLPIYTRIVEYKTAYYSFYLPVACALLMAGENLDNHVPAKKILVKMGVYFQVQDDYLDCFGDPEVIGKIGSDIEDFKCSWLLVKALEKADESQRQRLNANYGKKDPSCIADVKALYNELKLEEDFLEYENASYKQLVASIEDEKSASVQLMLKSFLKKIYKRQK